MSPQELHPHLNLLFQYGEKSNSSFHLQKGTHTFSLTDIGFLSYEETESADIVYLKPVASSVDLPLLIDRFLEFQKLKNKKRDRSTLFCSVDEELAQILKSYGYKINSFGEEFFVHIPTFEVKGKQMKYLRNIQNYGDRGVIVKELSWNEIDPQEVISISKEWRQNKRVKDRELRLLTNPPQFRDSWMERKFYAFYQNQLVGYIFFNPYFSQGKVKGYCANILRSRRLSDVPGIQDFIMLKAFEQFKKEGIEWLALGLAPLFNIEEYPNDRPFLRWCLQQMYQRGSVLYSFERLAFHKLRYRGISEKVYMASPPHLGTLSMIWTMLRATNVIPKMEELLPWFKNGSEEEKIDVTTTNCTQ